MTISAGIDLGSTTIKIVVLENGRLKSREVVESASQPSMAAAALIRDHGPDIPLVATGYGR